MNCTRTTTAKSLPAHLNTRWLKASVLGSIWAASEIVVGSFLHNLRLPFAGNVLTAIAIILLISMAQIWKEKGLFWRSGVVCALMKSVSPSAVILGPMIAIFFEGLLMELSVRIFKRNVFSYLLAGALAMLWNLVFVAANYLLIYGYGIVELYSNLTVFAQKQLNTGSDLFWMPLAVLAAVYVALGVIPAGIAIGIGRKVARSSELYESLTEREVLEIKSARPAAPFPYSIPWLGISTAMLIGLLALMSFTSRPVWIPAGCAALLMWALRYRNSLRGLMRPGFWIGFVLLTMGSALLLQQLRGSENAFAAGMWAGLEMNFRAALVIVGFSAIGTELRNPRIGQALGKSGMQQLRAALETAFQTLPGIIAGMPPLRECLRKPMGTFRLMTARAGYWLNRATIQSAGREKVIILKGPEHIGKSTLLAEVVSQLRASGINVAGFVAPPATDGQKYSGHDILDLQSGRRFVLSRIAEGGDEPRVGRYVFNRMGMDAGRTILTEAAEGTADLVVVDEVGPWELKNQGWAPALDVLVVNSCKPLLWVVRQSIVEQVCDRWALINPLVLTAGEMSAGEISAAILSHTDLN